MAFRTGTTAGSSTERMRISGGNLLVGKTASNSGTVGVEARATGRLFATADGAYAAKFERLSSDGTLIQLTKDGTTVGSIGNNGNRPYFASTNCGIRLGAADLLPATSVGVISDNVVSLGSSSGRFKDLYLSSGVYLGGTGAANKLDDYEEGDYEAAVTMGSGTLTLNTSFNRLSYTKVGRLVTVTGLLIASAASGLGGSVRINLPFTSASLTGRAGDSAGSISVVNSASCAAGSFALRISESDTSFATVYDGSGTSTVNASSSMASNVQLYLSITYVAA